MARIVAFFNQKGGTAKTTSTLNVAAALVERGRRVLMVDLDPQASLSMATGVDITALPASVYDLLLDEEVPLTDVIVPSSIPGADLVPSHPDLAAAELELLNELERERRLDYRVREADLSVYDYLMIDSPPALNIISINILVAAHELVVPIEPHPLSLMVLRRLFETVRRIKRLNPGLTVHGFLPTKVHHSSRLAADMLATLEEEFPDLALLPAVPLSVRGAESVAERTSVLHYMPRSAVATAYRDVAAWLDTHDPATRPAEEGSPARRPAPPPFGRPLPGGARGQEHHEGLRQGHRPRGPLGGGALRAGAAEGPDALAAVGLRNEPVQGRADVGELLRPVDLQVAGLLVELVLHRVGGHDLDERGHRARRIVADGDAVPGVRLEQQREVAEIGRHVDALTGRSSPVSRRPKGRSSCGADAISCSSD